MHVLYRFADKITGDGCALERDAGGRLSLALKLDAAAPRTLIFVDNAPLLGLAEAILAAIRETPQ